MKGFELPNLNSYNVMSNKLNNIKIYGLCEQLEDLPIDTRYVENSKPNKLCRSYKVRCTKVKSISLKHL
jgi:hypothetical protein